MWLADHEHKPNAKQPNGKFIYIFYMFIFPTADRDSKKCGHHKIIIYYLRR